jgi:hypothetical protein
MDTALYERMVNHAYGNGGRPGPLVEETRSKEAHGWGGPEIHAKGGWLETAPGPRSPRGHGIQARRSKRAAFGRRGSASDDEHDARCPKYGFGSPADIAHSCEQ